MVARGCHFRSFLSLSHVGEASRLLGLTSEVHRRVTLRQTGRQCPSNNLNALYPLQIQPADLQDWLDKLERIHVGQAV